MLNLNGFGGYWTSSFMDAEKLEHFERAFSQSTGGCLRTCECGIVYFDAHNDGYDWDEGEFEKLMANPLAVALDYAPGDITFEGKEFVNGCNCWHARAEKLMGFIDGHAHAIAAYLTLEKRRKQLEADTSPVVIG